MLDREAGATLLERIGRNVRFTEAGRALVRHAATPLEAAEAEPAGIAAGHPAGVVAALAQSSPDIRVEATELEVEEGVPALRLQQLDARVDKALCKFARRYADQTEADHEALVGAVHRGLLPVERGV